MAASTSRSLMISAHPADHVLGDLGHPLQGGADVVRHGHVGDPEAGDLGDVDRQVAHPLELADHPQRGDDHPQVAGHRLLEGQQREGVVLDPLAVGVDGLVGADDLLGHGGVAAQQRLGGAAYGHLHLTAHLGEIGEDGIELVMEGLTHDPQPRWPHVPSRPPAVNAW